MATLKGVIEYLHYRLLRTKKFQALFYWILLLVTIVSYYFVSGIDLLIILIFISGLTVYYVYIMVENAKEQSLKINNENNDLLKKCTSELIETINIATQKINNQIDAHNNEIKDNISLLMETVNNQTLQLSQQIANKTETINAFADTIASQKTKEITDAIMKFESNLTNLSKAVQDSIIVGIKETQELDANNLEKLISAGLSNHQSISNIIDSSFKHLDSSQTDTKTELMKMLSMLGDSVILQSGEITQQIIQNAVSIKEQHTVGIADIKEHAYILAQETKMGIFETLDNKTKLISGNIENNSTMAIESILSLENNTLAQMFEATNKIIGKIEFTGDQVKIAICDNISSSNSSICNEFALNRNKLTDMNEKLCDLAKDIPIQKASLSNELDLLMKEMIRCISMGFENHSGKILETIDERVNYIEKLNEGIVAQLERSSKDAERHEEYDRLEISKVHTEINLLEQSNKVLQKNNLDALNRQEQIWEDIQIINSQLNNIRLLLNLVKSSDEVKKERKGNVEVIEDKVNNLRVSNIYEDVLKKSEMYSANKLKYYVEYDKQGKICYSKNYDLNGNVLTETFYYPNEQVKERIEWTKPNGKLTKISTCFDENGNKKG